MESIPPETLPQDDPQIAPPIELEENKLPPIKPPGAEGLLHKRAPSPKPEEPEDLRSKPIPTDNENLPLLVAKKSSKQHSTPTRGPAVNNIFLTECLGSISENLEVVLNDNTHGEGAIAGIEKLYSRIVAMNHELAEISVAKIESGLRPAARETSTNWCDNTWATRKCSAVIKGVAPVVFAGLSNSEVGQISRKNSQSSAAVSTSNSSRLSLTDLHRLFGQRPTLSSQDLHLLDPITRNAIRSENCAVAKAAGLELTDDWNKHMKQSELVHKISDTVWLYMFETGIVSESLDIATSYLKEILTGTVAFQKQIYGEKTSGNITALFNLLNMSRGGEGGKGAEDLDIELIDNIEKRLEVQLEIVYHAVVLLNDKAFEGLEPEQIKKGRKPLRYVFSDAKLISTIVKGLIGVLSNDVIKAFFKDQKSTRLVNRILQSLLSLESDQTLLGLHWLEFLPPLERVKDVESVTRTTMVTHAAQLNKLLKELCQGVYSPFPIDYAGTSHSDAAKAAKFKETEFRLTAILEAVQLKGSTTRARKSTVRWVPGQPVLNPAALGESINLEKTFWFSVLDLPTHLLWLGLLLFGALPKAKAIVYNRSILELVADYAARSPVVQGQFFKPRNFALFKAINRASQFELLDPLERIFNGPHFVVVSRSPEFFRQLADFLSPPVTAAWEQTSPFATPSYGLVRPAVLCLETLRLVLQALSKQPKCRRSRMQLEICVQKLLAPRVNGVLSYFSVGGLESPSQPAVGAGNPGSATKQSQREAKSLHNVLRADSQHNPTVFESSLSLLSQRFWPQSGQPQESGQLDPKRTFSNHSMTNNQAASVPERCLFAELALHTLRLYNDGIRFSGGFMALFGGQHTAAMTGGKYLDLKASWSHTDFEYLRQVPGGNTFLGEIQCFYAHHKLFNRLIDFSGDPRGDEDNPSAVGKRKHNASISSPGNMSLLDLQRINSRAPIRPLPDLVNITSNKWTNILHRKPAGLFRYCEERTIEICQMLSKAEGMLRESSNANPKAKVTYCLRGPMKILHRYLCGLLSRVPPQEYHLVKLESLVLELKDNFDSLIKLLQLEVTPPSADNLLAEYTPMAKILDAENKGITSVDKNTRNADRSGKYSPEQQQLFKQNQLVILKLVTLIEALFNQKGFSLEIIEVRRETDFELNHDETSDLYAGIGMCENLALSSWMKIVSHSDAHGLKNNTVKKTKKGEKGKPAVDGLDGETPQETLERDKEFEQVFSQAYTAQGLGLRKGLEDFYDSDSEEEPEEIHSSPEKPPTRALSKEPKSLATFENMFEPTKRAWMASNASENLSGYFKARKQLLHEKRLALSEESCFFSSVDIGSNVSDLAYWKNLIEWIHFVLTNKLNLESAAPIVTDLSLLFFDEDFISLINILHNFTKQKKHVRVILHECIVQEQASLSKKGSRQTKDAVSKSAESDPMILKSLTVDQYLFNSVILLQHALRQAVLGTNLKLEMEEFFVSAKLISSLMENNCNHFKKRLIEFTLEPELPKTSDSHRSGQEEELPKSVNALGMMYDGLVLNSEITEPNICTEDRGDLVWYNITCLTLMAECMSGPFELAQNSLGSHISQKASYIRLLKVCTRINTNINSSFFDLQEAVVEFLGAIFEGVNKDTTNELNSQPESTPTNMFRMMVAHLENLWNYSDRVIQTKRQLHAEKADKPKSLPLDPKHPDFFQNLLANLRAIETHKPASVKKSDPQLEELKDYYTLHPSFSSHPSISVARKLYDIMIYAETIELRKFSRFLQQKRVLMEELDTEDTKTKVFKVLGNIATGEFMNEESDSKKRGSRPESASEEAGTVQPAGQIANPGASDGQRELNKSTMLFKFLMEITGSVEVVVDKKRVCVQFPILPECKFITEEEVKHFMRGCSLEDPNTRLFELIDFVDEVMIDKQNDMKFYKLFPPLIYLTRRSTFKMMVLAIWIFSAAINCIWIISSDVVDTTPTEEILERLDTISVQNSTAQLAILILSIIIVVLSLVIFVIWLFTRWLNLVNIKELKLKKQKALNTEFQTRILKFKAYVIDSLLGQPLPMVLLMHILFVIMYYTITDFFVCLHLLLFVYHSETTRYIMKSVTKDLKKIGITFLMIIFMVYCYSTIIGYHYSDQFKSDFESINPCQDWLSCLVYTFDYGLRLGGGVGDAMNLLPRNNSYFTEKLIINLTFLLLIKLIASNIVLGIIIDTFSDLRDSQSTREALLENECFICGIEKNEFEKREKSFSHHVEHEHKILSYIHFMVYLKSKKSDQISGVELYVRELFVKQKSTEWYPIQNTLFLDSNEESTEDKVMFRFEQVLKYLGELEAAIKKSTMRLSVRLNMPIKEKKERNVYEDYHDSDEDDDNNDKDSEETSEPEAFQDFYEEFKEQDRKLEENIVVKEEVEEHEKPANHAKSRKQKAKELWKLKKAELQKELAIIDTWKQQFLSKIKEESALMASSIAEKVPSGGPVSAEATGGQPNSGGDKPELGSKSGSLLELHSSIMAKVKILQNLQTT